MKLHAAYRRCLLVALASGCTSLAPAPSLTSVTPARVCTTAAATLTLAGDGFGVRLHDVLGQPAADLPSVTVSDGGPTLALPTRWQSVEEVLADLAANTLGAGRFDVTVTNPDGAAATLAMALTVEGPPRVDSVMPTRLCSGGSTLTVAGAGFLDGATTSLLDPAGGMRLAATRTTVSAPTRLDAQFGAPAFNGNPSLTLVVANADGCSAALPNAVRLGVGNCP
jgi:hypothetical protein